MRPIAYLVTGYPLPSHTFIQNEVRGLRRLGLNILTFTPQRARPEHVLSGADREEFATTYAWRPINVRHHGRAHLAALARARGRYGSALLGAWSRRGTGLRAAVRQFMYFGQAVVLWHRCARAGVRHIHVHFANSSCDIAMIATALGGPTWTWSLSMHGPTEFFDVAGLRVPLKVSQASFVVCISEFCRSQLMAFSDPEIWPRFEIVHCGVDVDRIRPRVRPASPTPSRPIEIVCVGRLVDEKGQRILLESLAQLRALTGQPARVCLVGDGPARPRLEQRARELDLEQAVEFTGALSHPEVLERVATADVFCLPSFAEGVPVSLMEAMALGIPVVSTRIMGIPELVGHEESGLLVAPGNPGLLADALARVATDHELRTRLAQAGREAVERDFALQATNDRLATVFREHLATR